MGTTEGDPRVDDYIETLPAWQRHICRQVRELVHAADPEVQETIKRRVPYFVRDGNVCALLAAKRHVCVFLYDGGIVPDPERIITDGHDNRTARQISIPRGRHGQRPRATRDVRADHREQPSGGLAEAQARPRAAHSTICSAVIGSEVIRAPYGDSASSMAALMIAGVSIRPPSPAPLIP